MFDHLLETVDPMDFFRDEEEVLQKEKEFHQITLAKYGELTLKLHRGPLILPHKKLFMPTRI